MLFTVKKNTNQTWDIVPNSGPFAGFCIGSAEAVDMTSVELLPGKAVGLLKAVWGLHLDPGLDIFSHMETARGIGLGRAFKDFGGQPVTWAERVYDAGTGRALQRTRRLIIIGSQLFRRD